MNEYNSNSAYNSSHYSYKAEQKIIKFMQEKNIFDEFLSYCNDFDCKNNKKPKITNIRPIDIRNIK